MSLDISWLNWPCLIVDLFYLFQILVEFNFYSFHNSVGILITNRSEVRAQMLK